MFSLNLFKSKKYTRVQILKTNIRQLDSEITIRNK